MSDNNNITERLMDMLEKIQSDPGTSKISMDKFQLQLILDQADWRGGITTGIENIKENQTTAFAALNKRFDKLEEDYEKDQIETNAKIHSIRATVDKLKNTTVKTAVSVTLLTSIVLIILSKLLHIG